MHEAKEFCFHSVHRWTSHVKAVRSDRGASYELVTNTSKKWLSSASDRCFRKSFFENLPCFLLRSIYNEFRSFRGTILTAGGWVVPRIQYGTDKWSAGVNSFTYCQLYLLLQSRRRKATPTCSLPQEERTMTSTHHTNSDAFSPSDIYGTSFFQIKLLRALRKSVKHTIICPKPGRSSSDRAQQQAITVKSSSGQLTGWEILCPCLRKFSISKASMFP